MCEAGLGYLWPWGFVFGILRERNGGGQTAQRGRDLGTAWGGPLGVSRAAASDKAAPPRRVGQWNEWAINSRQWEAGDAPLKSSGSSKRPSFFCAEPGAASTGTIRPCTVRHPGERVQGSGVALRGATRWGAGLGHRAQSRCRERASDPPGNLGCAGLRPYRPR